MSMTYWPESGNTPLSFFDNSPVQWPCRADHFSPIIYRAVVDTLLDLFDEPDLMRQRIHKQCDAEEASEYLARQQARERASAPAPALVPSTKNPGRASCKSFAALGELFA